jgi:Ca2+-binding EF-hand superfamily protein
VFASQQIAKTPFTQSLQVSESTKQQYLDELFFCYDQNGDGLFDRNETSAMIDGQLAGTLGECEGYDSELLSKNSSYFG